MNSDGVESGRDRVGRIDRSYHGRWDRLEWAKYGVAAAFVAATLALWGWSVNRGEAGWLTSPGPVASPHAAWESQCGACHAAAGAVRPGTFASAWWGTPVTAAERCVVCHKAPAHDPKDPAASQDCAACHHDHQGRNFSLVRLDDETCLNCHRDLEGRLHCSGPFAATTHPPFSGVPAKEKSGMTFTHALHLRAGLRGKGREFTLDRLSEDDRKRYSRYQTKEGLKLECAACHRLDRDEQDRPGAEAGRRPRHGGAGFEPVRFEDHCRACHPQRLHPEDPARQAPHGLQLAELTSLLRGDLLARLGPRPRLDASPDRPTPGREPRRLPPPRDVEHEVTRLVGLAVEGRDGCALCHQMTKAAPPKIVPTEVRPVWLEHGLFDHAAHRAVTCQECHAKAAISVEASDVLVPGIDTCVTCHAPQSRGPGLTTGGVRSRCTDCHQYHRGTHPLQGRGSAPRDAGRKRSASDLLNGG